MSSDPYKSPNADEPTIAATPGPVAIASAVFIALFYGTLIFVGTCFGGGMVAYAMSYNNPYPELTFAAVWIVSGATGILSAVYIGRIMYRRAQRMAALDAENRAESSES